MFKHKLIDAKHDIPDKCEKYIQAKLPRKSFPKGVERNTKKCIQAKHSDICELNNMLTRGGNRYFITFIDDCSKYTYVYILKYKDEVFSKFKVYKALVENQRSRKIKVLHNDRGGEYFPT